MITIVEGNVYQSTAMFTDESGSLVDPTTVDFVYEVDGLSTSKVTLAYASATTPAPGLIAKTAVGVYVAQVDLTTIAGTLQRYWQSTGVGQAVSTVGTIIVPAIAF